MGFNHEPQAEIAEGALVSFVQSDQSPFMVQDLKPALQAAKKKKGKIKVAGEGLEGFLEWVHSISSDPVEEMEDDMSNLAAGFHAQICKQAVSDQGKTTPCFEVSCRKHSR